MSDALIPLGQKMMDLADRLMPALGTAIVLVIDAVVPLVDWLIAGIDALAGMMGGTEDMQGAMMDAAQAIETTFGPIIERAQELFAALGEKVSAVVGQNLNYFSAWILSLIHTCRCRRAVYGKCRWRRSN